MSRTGAVKIAWLSLAVLMAVPLVVTYNPTANRDNDIVLAYVLLTLTFPTGFVVAAFYSLLGYVLWRLFSLQLPAGRLPMIVDSFVFLSAGYVQWFVILPTVWKALKRKRLRTDS
jgi:hypothetical protein